MQRERYIDIVKGVSIVCIVLLHYVIGVIPKSIEVFIGSFMISTFYLTSGWISAMQPRKRTFHELLQKRWHQLGIPYLWWSLIILCFDFILLIFGFYDFRYIGQEVYKTITLRGIGTLWFLPALFGGELLWFWLNKHKKRYLVLALILTIAYLQIYKSIFSGQVETIYRIVDAPFRTLANILNAWIGIGFGYYAYSILNRFINSHKHFQIFFTGLILCIIAFFTSNFLPQRVMFLWMLFAPLLGPLGIILIAKTIQKSHWMDFFHFWGINSLALMVTHYSILLVLFRLIVNKFFGLPFEGWPTVICFAFSMIIQWSLNTLLDKYAKRTLGKTKHDKIKIQYNRS